MGYLGINLIKKQSTILHTLLKNVIYVYIYFIKYIYMEKYIMSLSEKTQFHKEVNCPKLVYTFNVEEKKISI